MKHVFFCLCVFALFFSPLSAEERIGGTLENVDLMVIDLFNEDGHNYGERYTVHNRNDLSMRISIKLIENDNAEEHLVRYTIIVASHDHADLGYVVQNDLAQGANWKYEWHAQHDRH